MKIVADENIPYVREAFGPLGDVTTLSGRAMTNETVKSADILLVRSITKVNSDLLDGSSVRFVATATIGEDHIDKGYLESRGIGFASAPGSNANSVAEYVVSALVRLAEAFSLKLHDLTLGIVGVGNVGSKVAVKAAALGMTCVLNDPPLARQTGDARYRPIEEICACDIVTFHVPLTKRGPDATYHLVGEKLIGNLRPGTILFNTSRGAVADGAALKAAMENGHLKAVVLDVWEGEPSVDVGLLEEVFLGTPHIAGYSFDGKVNGTRQIYEAASRFFGIDRIWDPSPLLPDPECPEVRVSGDASSAFDAIRKAVLAVYDVRRDHDAMEEILMAKKEERALVFDQLRKEYPRRREFHNTRVVVEPPNEGITRQLAGLGFNATTAG